jgi:hypothetical protein
MRRISSHGTWHIDDDFIVQKYGLHLFYNRCSFFINIIHSLFIRGLCVETANIFTCSLHLLF